MVWGDMLHISPKSKLALLVTINQNIFITHLGSRQIFVNYSLY